jgi:hypothetical protein
MSVVKLSLLSVFALASCGMEEMSDLELQIGCPGGNCHLNSPVMGPYKFWEGNLAGKTNLQGVKFGDFVSSSNRRCRPRVIGDKLSALCPATVLPSLPLTTLNNTATSRRSRLTASSRSRS